MARQKNIFSVMAMVTVGASAFILPLKQPLNGPALCVQRASSTARFAVSQDELKKQVGYKSVDDYVQSGMVVGLGTGSTAAFAVERLGMKLKADPALNLVKGRGGALLREKMVEVCAKKFIVIVDDSKMVPGLGVTGAMPVEITPFCHEHTQRTILELPGVKGAATGKLRMDGDKPYVTDNDNYIVDLYYTDPIADVKAVARALEGVVGVVEHGFFLDMTTAVIVAGKEGIEVINKK
ncbi:ribose-5-phosphate isomerase [Nannochloropsis gaditana]|uniref:ribose-5-phosphate isomerase n=1 Tax=Nannochloropsis gaditana TaxID=72520 RepID=W7TL54_9STRA|nr:ribose-5-phosphate isomerase [Nannochloropsis gaditana]